MKNAILVFLFLCSSLFNPAKAQDTAGMKKIELQKVEINHGRLYGDTWHYLINSVKEYRKVIGGKPDIDFAKYTLIGVHDETGGCAEPTVSYAFFYSEVDSSYVYEFNVQVNGPCERLNHIDDWFIVPKIEDINRIHFYRNETVKK